MACGRDRVAYGRCINLIYGHISRLRDVIYRADERGHNCANIIGVTSFGYSVAVRESGAGRSQSPERTRRRRSHDLAIGKENFH